MKYRRWLNGGADRLLVRPRLWPCSSCPQREREVTGQLHTCHLSATALIEHDSIRDRDEQLSAIPIAPTGMPLSHEVTSRARIFLREWDQAWPRCCYRSYYTVPITAPIPDHHSPGSIGPIGSGRTVRAACSLRRQQSSMLSSSRALNSPTTLGWLAFLDADLQS